MEIEKQSLVVYHIRCKDCKEDYIGKTARIFRHRLNDHKTSCKGKEDTAIHAHHLLTGHKIDFENVKIIDRADSDRKLQLMHIDKKKPNVKWLIMRQSYMTKNDVIWHVMTVFPFFPHLPCRVPPLYVQKEFLVQYFII